MASQGKEGYGEIQWKIVTTEIIHLEFSQYMCRNNRHSTHRTTNCHPYPTRLLINDFSAKQKTTHISYSLIHQRKFIKIHNAIP